MYNYTPVFATLIADICIAFDICPLDYYIGYKRKSTVILIKNDTELDNILNYTRPTDNKILKLYTEKRPLSALHIQT